MKRLLLVLMTAFVALSLAGCKDGFPNPNETYCDAGRVDGVYLCSRPWSTYFDTTVTLTLYVTAADTYDIVATFTAVDAILARYHELFDKYHTYDGVVNLMTVNLSGTTPTTVDADFYAALEAAFALADDIVADGAELFDPALGPVLSIWHAARESDACEETGIAVMTCPIPSAEALAGPFATDLADVLLDPVARTVSFARPGMSLDLGGFAKGYVSELVTDYLDGLGATYIFNAGNSNVKAGGVNPNNDTGDYYVALTRPSYQAALLSDYYVYLKVPGGMSIVTSGTYQRFFYGATDGAVYHHIIDPRTNRPGGEAMAVTILLPDGAKGDAYSTAIFLLTVEEGLAFVESVPDLEAVWYRVDGTIVTSSGFARYLYQWVTPVVS